MHRKWRKQMMMFILRAYTASICPTASARRSLDFNLDRFPEIKTVDRRTSKELSLRANLASRALAMFNFGLAGCAHLVRHVENSEESSLRHL
jgi:hypothetical protein